MRALCQAKQVDRAQHGSLHRVDRIELVVRGARRTSQIVDVVDLGIEGPGHVVRQQVETRVRLQMRKIGAGSGEEAVDAEHVDIVAAAQQPVAQMRTEKAGCPGHQHTRRASWAGWYWTELVHVSIRSPCLPRRSGHHCDAVPRRLVVAFAGVPPYRHRSYCAPIVLPSSGSRIASDASGPGAQTSSLKEIFTGAAISIGRSLLGPAARPIPR